MGLARAWLVYPARQINRDRRIRSAWLLVALLQTPELRSVLLGISAAFRRIPIDSLVESVAAIIAGSPEEREGAHDGSGLASATPGEASGAIAEEADGKSALAKYCVDLTQSARAGEIDPVIGREHEIRTMVDILLRRRQNNPLLTGEAGVGKTAVVEGLALAIARGEVPATLREVRLLSLDVGALLAGASMRGEFESRLKGLLEEATRSQQPVILFIDEVHTLVGAGGQAGTGDAAKLNITQTAKRITISAEEELMFSGGGSYIRLNAAANEQGTSGRYINYAASHSLIRPKNVPTPSVSGTSSLQELTEKKALSFELLSHAEDGRPLALEPFTLYKDGAKVADGVTDANGTVRIENHDSSTASYKVTRCCAVESCNSRAIRWCSSSCACSRRSVRCLTAASAVAMLFSSRSMGGSISRRR